MSCLTSSGYVNHWLISDNEKFHRIEEFNVNQSIFELNSGSIELIVKYGWIIKAILSGLATLFITWYIIYMDSNIPGINPPSPFRNSKTR